MRSEIAASDKLASQLMLVAAIVFAMAAATIMSAHAFEQFGGYAPCPLCLQQRYAYYFAVPASVIAFFAARGDANGAARILLLLIVLAFLINAGLGVYHAGVEWKWWPGPNTCAGGTTVGWGESGLAEQLENAQVIRCDEAQWRFLNLSFAGWNVVISALLACIAGWGAAQRR